MNNIAWYIFSAWSDGAGLCGKTDKNTFSLGKLKLYDFQASKIPTNDN